MQRLSRRRQWNTKRLSPTPPLIPQLSSLQATRDRGGTLSTHPILLVNDSHTPYTHFYCSFHLSSSLSSCRFDLRQHDRRPLSGSSYKQIAASASHPHSVQLVHSLCSTAVVTVLAADSGAGHKRHQEHQRTRTIRHTRTRHHCTPLSHCTTTRTRPLVSPTAPLAPLRFLLLQRNNSPTREGRRTRHAHLSPLPVIHFLLVRFCPRTEVAPTRRLVHFHQRARPSGARIGRHTTWRVCCGDGR